ncbi:MAG TPA: L-2-hydroxyglutarate oxidase [Chloroflexota bacterium]|nr:L-2-hydroxyglutarate oxidase [Chloroflexota bacterium]
MTIVGAGAIGCALARELSRRFPSMKIGVLEAAGAPAAHQSGRNSGVAHAGFNPAPGSLKARLCVEGNQLLREYCREKRVAFQDVGTVVAALSDVEEERLNILHRQGQENGVPGIRLLSLSQARQLEPNLADGIRLVLHAPSGAIMDSRAYVLALAEDARTAGVTFRFNTRLEGADRLARGWRLILSDGTLLDTGRVVNAAGVHVDEVARMFGWHGRYRIVPFRGRYWSVRGKDDIIRSMVYPTPDPHFPFLGVHVTKRVHGGVMLGPNAMLAFGRDAYSFWRVQTKDILSMMRAGQFWRLMRRPEVLRLAAAEIERSLNPRRFASEAARLVKGITAEDLAPGPPAGIRAQLVDEHGDLCEDFLLEVQQDAAHILNAVSPGLTSSMAFARYLAGSLFEQRFLPA